MEENSCWKTEHASNASHSLDYQKIGKAARPSVAQMSKFPRKMELAKIVMRTLEHRMMVRDVLQMIVKTPKSSWTTESARTVRSIPEPMRTTPPPVLPQTVTPMKSRPRTAPANLVNHLPDQMNQKEMNA